MAAATNIVINDGAATPVARTFSPSRKEGALVEYQERSIAHTPSGYYTIGLSGQMPRNGSVVARNRISFAYPREYLDTSTNLYSYPDVGRFTVDVIIPITWSQAQRDNLAAFLKNLIAHSVVQSMCNNLDFPF